MEMKVLWSGALFLVGWLWFFFFIRQLLFNFTIAYPMIKKIKKCREDLIAPTANKYTTVSVVTCAVFIGIVLFIILYFCKTYQKIAFLIGGAVGLLTYVNKLTYRDRNMFDTFCATYYRFIPDDELRTAMYNRKPSQMKLRLHDMEVPTDFIPEFKK
ncbi:MAG: hypothetical protein ACOX68_02370 [Candidatus Limivicinus sp.]